MNSQKVVTLEAEEEQLTGMVWILENICSAVLKGFTAATFAATQVEATESAKAKAKRLVGELPSCIFHTDALH